MISEPHSPPPREQVKIMSKPPRYLTTLLWLLMSRHGTYVGATCYGLATAVSHQSHREQLIFAIDTSQLKAQYQASRQELTGQVKIVDGAAVLPTFMCYTLTAGYDLHNFHPKSTLEELEGSYCLNTIFLKNSELVYTLDEHQKPKLQSFTQWKNSMKTSYQYDVKLSIDPKDRILIWSGKLKVDYLDSKLPVKAVANNQVHEADHLIKEILQKEEIFLKMISRLEKFMLTALPDVPSPDLGQAITQLEQFMMTAQTGGSKTKRNLIDFLLGPNLGV